jgi:hypothetical protein
VFVDLQLGDRELPQIRECERFVSQAGRRELRRQRADFCGEVSDELRAPGVVLLEAGRNREDLERLPPAAKRSHALGLEVESDGARAAEVLVVRGAEQDDGVGQLVRAHAAHLGDAGAAVHQDDVVAVLPGPLAPQPVEETIAFPIEVEVLPVEHADVQRVVPFLLRRLPLAGGHQIDDPAARPDFAARRLRETPKLHELRSRERGFIGQRLTIGANQVHQALVPPWVIAARAFVEVVLQTGRFEIEVDAQHAQAPPGEHPRHRRERHGPSDAPLVAVEREDHAPPAASFASIC